MADNEASSSFTVEQVAASGTVAQIAEFEAQRRSIIITNRDGADPVYLGPTAALATTSGYQLGAGEAITLDTKSAVWVLGSTAETIHVLKEYV